MIQIILSGGNDIQIPGERKLFEYYVGEIASKRVIKLDPDNVIFCEHVSCIRYLEDEK